MTEGGYTSTIADVRAARDRIAPYLGETPLFEYPALSELLEAKVAVKHENHQPVGAFKVRGGVNLVAQMPRSEKDRGVIAASTGNHGQSVAYASRLFGVDARIVVPKGANPLKVKAMQDLGAEVILKGVNFDEARRHCEGLAEDHGLRYIHSGDEPHLVEGVATYALEIVEKLPEVDVIIVPIGGGSGAAGTCLVAKSEGRQITVIGVQSQSSQAGYLSWKEQRLVDAANETFAEGLATGTAFALPQVMLRELLDDFVLVSDDEIRDAQRRMIESTRNLVEAAGAASLAAAIKIKDRLIGKTVALIASGGNATPDQLRTLLN